MKPRRISHEVVSSGGDAEALRIRNLEIAKARTPSRAVWRYLNSQKVDDFLEVFFAVLSFVYCVAAAGFAGILLGNAIAG
jgi:hypothetical protein